MKYIGTFQQVTDKDFHEYVRMNHATMNIVIIGEPNKATREYLSRYDEITDDLKNKTTLYFVDSTSDDTKETCAKLRITEPLTILYYFKGRSIGREDFPFEIFKVNIPILKNLAVTKNFIDNLNRTDVERVSDKITDGMNKEEQSLIKAKKQFIEYTSNDNPKYKEFLTLIRRAIKSGESANGKLDQIYEDNKSVEERLQRLEGFAGDLIAGDIDLNPDPVDEFNWKFLREVVYMVSIFGLIVVGIAMYVGGQ